MDSLSNGDDFFWNSQETLLAARRLLSVTCDCCEQLTENWDIAEPSQSILALLQINNPEAWQPKSRGFVGLLCPTFSDSQMGRSLGVDEIDGKSRC